MYYIIGDIGNTSTRICLLNKTRILKSLIFDTKYIFKKGFINGVFKKLIKNSLQKKILFSCVVPKALKKIKQIFDKKKYEIIEIKSLNLRRLIKINIKNISQLGSDRIVNSMRKN